MKRTEESMDVAVEASAETREQFVLRAQLMAVGIKRLSWRDETYLVEYSDRIALERAFAGRSVELRPLRSGQAHLVVPYGRRTPEDALEWIRALLQGVDLDSNMD